MQTNSVIFYISVMMMSVSNKNSFKFVIKAHSPVQHMQLQY